MRAHTKECLLARSAVVPLAAVGLALALLAPTALAAQPPLDADALQTAAALVDAAGTPGGIGVVIGPRLAESALALAKQGAFTVQGLGPDARRVSEAREAVQARGMYGSVSVRTVAGDGKRLPYASNLVALALVEGGPEWPGGALAAAELFRVVAPLGSVFVTAADASPEAAAWAGALAAGFLVAGASEGPPVQAGAKTWRHLRKPWPAAMDEWTHYLHGADGNPVAQDRLVGPPARTQWVAGPTWLRSHDTDSSVSTLVTAQGRLFAIVDEGPISLTGQHSLPDKWALVARDAFSGVPLWSVPIRRWGWREWKQTWFNTRPGDIPLNLQKRLVAVGDRVYATLGFGAPVSALDARTGAILRSYPETEGTREILCLGGVLFVSVPAGRQVRVKACEAESGRLLWTSARAYRGSTVDYIRWTEGVGSPAAAELDPSLNTATDGQTLALIDGPDIVALDARTGAERWRTAFPADPADRNAGGMGTDGSLWIGTMIVSVGVVLHASPGCLAALDASDGRVLWKQPKRYIGHLWYEWKDVFVIEGLVWTWSADLEQGTFETGGKAQRALWPVSLNGYDLRSGEPRRKVPLGSTFRAHHHHRCYRNKATSRFVLASRRGTECIDLETGVHTIDNWVRGTCHVGMMPANGLHYAPPHPCACYIEEKLSGFLALAPTEGPVAAAPAGTRLEPGPALGQPLPAPAVDPAQEWPEFRHDGDRTGAVKTTLPATLGRLWRTSLGGRLSAPVAAGGRVLLAQVDGHRVVCLDADDGRELWSYTADSRIDSPPTVTGAQVLFGAADGWLYCLRAADGALEWRFRAAPEERQVAAHGQLESAWPVHGSVLVRAGKAYVVAGRSSHLDGGLFLCGLDLGTGTVACERRIEGPSYTSATVAENHKLAQGLLPDILMNDGDGIAMRAAGFDLRLEPRPARPALQTRAGFLDDSYFKRTPWTMAGEHARLIVHDDRQVYYVRMFDTLRCLDPSVYFTPGSQGYLLFARNLPGAAKTWSVRVPIRIRAMVLTLEQLLVAGPPDVLADDDPLGAFEGRKGGLLQVVDAASGAKRAEHTLPSPPVFNGAAAARGRLFLTLEDGSVECYGGP
jgi:outer membrane protein assembly factor BamB